MAGLLGFLGKYFFDAIIVFAVGMFSTALIKQFGNERGTKIKESILAGMLWAEEAFGLNNGDEKWTKAWQKIIELLKEQGITLKEKEIPYVTTLMKANIPEINAITYASQPEAVIEARFLSTSRKDYQDTIDELRKKYVDEKTPCKTCEEKPYPETKE
jgi:Asp-tRNA(Asn)/Glu-tRNA(Gln) amidotransferase A subunit family amidase